MSQQQGAPPVVFSFRPESYKVLESSDEIKEWERLMKERIGLSADLKNLSGTCCESWSGGVKDDCDQD